MYVKFSAAYFFFMKGVLQVQVQNRLLAYKHMFVARNKNTYIHVAAIKIIRNINMEKI